MRRAGVLNQPLSCALAGLGHTDTLVVCDCGLPRPAGVPVVDLAVVFGVPSFAQVLDALLGELVVEGATLAQEAREHNPAVVRLVGDRVGAPRWVSHEQLKQETGSARLLVRTGEATAYANVILRCGVPF